MRDAHATAVLDRLVPPAVTMAPPAGTRVTATSAAALLLALLPTVLAAASTGRHAVAAASVGVSVNLSASSRWDHYGERMVGTSHIAMNARADWREHLTMVAKDLGAKYVRGHGMFDNDMHVSYARGLNSWVSLDSYVDFLLSIGMRPAFELGFSPDWMATNNTIVGKGSPQHGPHGRIGTGYGYRANMSPPNNTLWAEFIGAYAKHIVERYGGFVRACILAPDISLPAWPCCARLASCVPACCCLPIVAAVA
jgi:hypothetical protein